MDAVVREVAMVKSFIFSSLISCYLNVQTAKKRDFSGVFEWEWQLFHNVFHSFCGNRVKLLKNKTKVAFKHCLSIFG